MSPLPSQEELRYLKAVETTELARRQEWEIRERRGLAEAHAGYWGMVEDFVARATDLGIEPRRHEPTVRSRAAVRVQWVEGFRLRSGSIIAAPSHRYCIRERRLVLLPREEIHEAVEVTLFLATTDAGLSGTLSEPKTASEGTWPALERWDRAANVLKVLEAELQATLLESMRTGRGDPAPEGLTYP